MSATEKVLMDSVDHAWLRMENDNNLMMIGVVLLFDAKLELERLRDILQTRLVAKYDRFSQRVVHENGRDYWETDPDFSIDNHLVPIGFPHDGDKQALQSLASEIVSTPLERDKPLWCVNEISHYQGGSVLVIRIHHCIADGMSLVRLVISLTDDCADPASAELCMSKPTGGAGSHHHESLRDLISHPLQL
ncbi:MAG: wax ester/triacylglycerol synthase family O-acyltransferase, partial [Ketobacteraceae bacterium]|nr:wax ester/triacylglycerol synthase family O-acyltransferase [Ketobacteraceae bacterium]